MTYREHRDFFDEKKTVKFQSESGVHPAVRGQHCDYKPWLWLHHPFQHHSVQALLSTQLTPEVNTRGVCEQPKLILTNPFLEMQLSLREECAGASGKGLSMSQRTLTGTYN